MTCRVTVIIRVFVVSLHIMCSWLCKHSTWKWLHFPVPKLISFTSRQPSGYEDCPYLALRMCLLCDYSALALKLGHHSCVSVIHMQGKYNPFWYSVLWQKALWRSGAVLYAIRNGCCKCGGSWKLWLQGSFRISLPWHFRMCFAKILVNCCEVHVILKWSHGYAWIYFSFKQFWCWKFCNNFAKPKMAGFF